MYINPALVDDLHLISSDHDLVSTDLPQQVQGLEDMATRSIRSLLGWSLFLTVLDRDVRLSCLQPWVEPDDVSASLRVELTPAVGDGYVGMMVMYAGRPDAFLKMAAALVSTRGTGAGRLLLDRDLHPDLTARAAGVDEVRDLNRAITAMLAQGDTVERAVELPRLDARPRRLAVVRTRPRSSARSQSRGANVALRRQEVG